MRNKKIIFLDFDGVLHRDGISGGALFEHLDAFSEAIRPYLEKTYIVISSSWREQFPLDDVKGFFSDDIASCIIGITPVFLDGYANGGREREIRSYCDSHGIRDTNWIAIDDMDRLFTPQLKNLLHTDRDIGLCDGDLRILQHFLAS